MAVTRVIGQVPFNLSITGRLSCCNPNRLQQSEKPNLYSTCSYKRQGAAQSTVVSKRTFNKPRSLPCESYLFSNVPPRSLELLSEVHYSFQAHTFSKHFEGATSLICQAKSKHDKDERPKSRKEKGVPPTEQDQLPLRLILLRHAKSSWDNPTLADHERPLNKRGRKAAPDVAAQIRARGWLPDLILSSDSVRTRETLKRMGEEWQELAGVPAEFLYSFYDVAAADEGPTDTAQHLEDVVVEKGGNARSVMLVGHNMGWEQAASHFAGEYVAMKTAFAVLLESPRSTWKEAFREKWHVAAMVKPESSKAVS